MREGVSERVRKEGRKEGREFNVVHKHKYMLS